MTIRDLVSSNVYCLKAQSILYHGEQRIHKVVDFDVYSFSKRLSLDLDSTFRAIPTDTKPSTAAKSQS